MIDPITPLQSKFFRDEHRFIIISAGRRSRKTLIAKQKIFQRALVTPNTRWFHAAPTRDQAKRIFWKDLKKYTTGLLAIPPNESELYVTLANNTEIHVIGMDKPQRIEGTQWHGCHLSEFGDFKVGAWENNIRPVLADTNGSAIIDGVPDPYKQNFNAHKKMAQLACGGAIPITEPGKGAYAENPEKPEWAFYSWFSSDVLPEDEMKSLKEETDPLNYRIEYEASFETISGRVYYAYSPDYYPAGNLDTSIVYDKNLPIVMGFDFNVNPMTAVLGHVKRNSDDKQEWLLFKGYFLKASNTEQLIARILQDYPETYSFILTPCQSSISKQSSQQITAEGYRTDLSIIRKAMKDSGRNIRICKRSKNPPIHKGVGAVNSMLSQKRIRFNPNDPGLKELDKDLQFLVYKEGTSGIDESDPMRNHISAALRYPCEYHWPVKYVSAEAQDNGVIV